LRPPPLQCPKNFTLSHHKYSKGALSAHGDNATLLRNKILTPVARTEAVHRKTRQSDSQRQSMIDDEDWGFVLVLCKFQRPANDASFWGFLLTTRRANITTIFFLCQMPIFRKSNPCQSTYTRPGPLRSKSSFHPSFVLALAILR
jgi:hypothetical protein